jgi:hypothetical protein
LVGFSETGGLIVEGQKIVIKCSNSRNPEMNLRHIRKNASIFPICRAALAKAGQKTKRAIGLIYTSGLGSRRAANLAAPRDPLALEGQKPFPEKGTEGGN